MKCPACGTDNSEDAQFCGNCGASTSVSEAKGTHSMVDRMIRVCREVLEAGLNLMCVISISDEGMRGYDQQPFRGFPNLGLLD